MMTLKVPHIGRFVSGQIDAITDVSNVTVGHATLDDGDVQTGVTVICPHPGNLFMQRVPAGIAVINGFGKSVGFMQIEELGVLETPIALTNTFSVPAVASAQIKQCIAQNPQCGKELSTVNPLVLECNDGYLNDIQRMAVSAVHYEQAYALAQKKFEQGSVGAGRGMSCFKLKGGIGSASRVVSIDGEKNFTVGVLVLANFGDMVNLTFAGRVIGPQLAQHLQMVKPSGDKGSIIMVVATDAPLNARQLRRLAVRAGAGLARTGSYYGHGSGDIALAFSTAYTVEQDEQGNGFAQAPQLLNDNQMNPLFEAVADAVEQSILFALSHSKTLVGRNGNVRLSLLDVLKTLSPERLSELMFT